MTTLELIKKLQHLAEQEAQGESPTLVHSQLLQGIQKLQVSVTTPAEKLFRMRFEICQSVCVRLAQQHGILQSLSKDGRATATELSGATGANESLIGRFLYIYNTKLSCLILYFTSTDHEALDHNRGCRRAGIAAVRSQSCDSFLCGPRYIGRLQILVSSRPSRNRSLNNPLTCWQKSARTS